MINALPVASEARATKLSATDKRIFRGTAAEVLPWMSNEDILSSIGCNFQVESRIPTVDGREYPDTRLWLRSDNRDHLGTFGNRRRVIQPSDFVTYFRDFCEKSGKAIELDLVGTPDNGKTFYMASKLIGNNLDQLCHDYHGRGFGIQGQIDSIDRTDAWLIITDYYGQSSAPKAIILLNELVCSNGMTRQSKSRLAGLSHLRQQGSEDVTRVILESLEAAREYQIIKSRLIDKKITVDVAVNTLKAFFRAHGTERASKADKLASLYTESLVGGNLATRQGTAWGLLSAVTQNTTHGRVGSTAEAQGRAFKSMLDGPRATEAAGFCDFLIDRLAIAV
jgi:hypothetical protein